MKLSFIKEKTLLKIIAIISLSGMFCLLMPWLEYPRIKLILNGSDGDGWLVSAVFFICLVLAVLSLKNGYGKNKNIAIIILSIIIFLVGIQKVYSYNLESQDFKTDNALIGLAAAGGKLKYGIFFFIACSYLGIIFSSLLLIIKRFNIKNVRKFQLRYLIVSIGLIALLGLYNTVEISSPKTNTEIRLNLDKTFSRMSTTLKNKEIERFADFTHPIIYQSVGGKRKMISMIADLYEEVELLENRIEQIVKIEQKKNNVQVLFVHKTVLQVEGEKIESSNYTIAFSYDNGDNWVFAGTEGKTFDEIRKLLPDIYDELRY